MTDAEFNALAASLGIKIEPIRYRHTVYVGTRSVVWFEVEAEAEAEAARLKEQGYSDIRICSRIY